MKQTKLILLAILLSLVESDLLAYSCKIDGICYNLNSTDHTAKVTYSGYPHNNEYTGSYGGGLKGVDVTIPSSITYNGIDYTVVAIGDYAFYDAESTVLMNSVSIQYHCRRILQLHQRGADCSTRFKRCLCCCRQLEGFQANRRCRWHRNLEGRYQWRRQRYGTGCFAHTTVRSKEDNMVNLINKHSTNQ